MKNSSKNPKKIVLSELVVGLRPFMNTPAAHATVGTKVSVGNLLNRGIPKDFGRMGFQEVVSIERLPEENLDKERKLHPEAVLGEPYYTIRDTYTG